MPFYKVNMMGGFRIGGTDTTLTDDRVHEFSEEEVAQSRGLAAALRNRWLIETDSDGRPLKKAPQSALLSASPRSPDEEADMYPANQQPDEEAELRRVNQEQVRMHFDDAALADDIVATPGGIVGPGGSATKSKPKAKKTADRKPKPKTRKSKARKARKKARKSKASKETGGSGGRSKSRKRQ